MRPKIGVTGPCRGGWPAWMATRIAVWRAGGQAVRITPSHPRSIDGLSGLIVGGGADVNPKLYNEECVKPESRHQIRREVRRRWRKRQTFAIVGFDPQTGFHPSLQKQLRAGLSLLRYRIGLMVDLLLLVVLWVLRHLMSMPWTLSEEHEHRDALEVPLIRDAIERGIPVLGICRGMQLINVCLGGSLYQEIAIFYEETPRFKTLLPRKLITIEKESHLCQIVHRTRAHVNSLHDQSVKSLGEGLRVVARESNGVIQAIEHTGARFILGVQWHPEYLAFEKPSQQRIFDSLVEAAKRLQPGTVTSARSEPSVFVPSSNRAAMSSIAVSQQGHLH